MTHSSKFKSASRYQNRVMDFYHQKIQQQQQLLQQIQAILPKHLAEHVLHCVLSEKKLILYTDAAIWSSQLRFYQTTILHSFSQTQLNLELLQIRLIPPTSTHKVDKEPLIPSKKNIDDIRNNAHQITDDKLQQALLNLSRTLERLSK